MGQDPLHLIMSMLTGLEQNIEQKLNNVESKLNNTEQRVAKLLRKS